MEKFTIGKGLECQVKGNPDNIIFEIWGTHVSSIVLSKEKFELLKEELRYIGKNKEKFIRSGGFHSAKDITFEAADGLVIITLFANDCAIIFTMQYSRMADMAKFLERVQPELIPQPKRGIRSFLRSVFP